MGCLFPGSLDTAQKEKYKIWEQKLENETETATEAQMDMVMGLLRCFLMKFASEGCGLLMWHIFP